MIVLVNKNSCGGTAQKKWERIFPKLNLNGTTEIVFINENGFTKDIILKAIYNGKTDFVIAGGDGSINYFINELLDLSEPKQVNSFRIGAVGIGSSNDFHKPFNTENLIDKIPVKLNFNEVAERDVGCLRYKTKGKVVIRYFLINASVGITAEGNNFFNKPDFVLSFLKKFNTQTAIIYAVLKNIFSYKNFYASIKIDGTKFRANISNLGIIKSPFFTGKLRYSSNPELNDGYFDVHLYQSLTKMNLMKLFFSLNRGLSEDSFNKKSWKTERISISSEKEFAVEFDGEVITTNDAEFSVIPRLIKVCTN